MRPQEPAAERRTLAPDPPDRAAEPPTATLADSRATGRLAGLLACALLACSAMASGCSHARMTEDLSEQAPRRETIDREEAFLKAHMENGDVVVLNKWRVDSADKVVRGYGRHYDETRQMLGEGKYEIDIDKTAIFETNVMRPTPAIIPMAVLSVGTVGFFGACAANPKMCYGSCPTFYAPGPDGEQLMAEGFSASVAPSLEKRDVDSLSQLTPSGDTLQVRMTNEALETHVVRGVELVAVPTPDGGTVYRTHDGDYLVGTDARPPSDCEARTGDCRAALAAPDGEAWETLADPENLGRSEHVTLDFPAPNGERAGLVLRVRQKFITTFLFYNFLSNLGQKAGEYMADFERFNGESFSQLSGLEHTFGHIEVQMRRPTDGADDTDTDDGDAKTWHSVGSVREFGPIARETQVVPLTIPKGAAERDSVKLRLKLTRGNWRVDTARLVELDGRATPQVIEPSSVRQTANGRRSDAKLRGDVTDVVRDDEQTLSTQPGDAYSFRFALPEAPEDYSYFLASKGYYLEWMRPKWTDDSDVARAAELLFFPDRALREMAPKFKKIEPKIEEMFWESRYVPQRK